MAKTRRKRRQVSRNKAEARKVVIVAVVLTIIFLVIAYLAFMSSV